MRAHGWVWLIVTAGLLAQDRRVDDELTRAVEAVSAEKIREYVTELAGDAYEGRNAGYPGNDKAAQFIARHCEAIGLKPLGDRQGDTRTYFQKFSHAKQLTTQNVVAFVEGSDPRLKSEGVVIGAHFDHAGKSGEGNAFARIKRKNDPKDDDIWNGADDNASGTATVMEIARAFMASGLKPRRSVIFVWFSAEEWGLLGSKHYCTNFPPEFPREKHVAMINLDMVGRNPDRPVSVNGCGTSDAWRKLLDDGNKGIELNLIASDPVDAGSDHYSFAAKTIPAIHFFTGFHSNYHRNTDHADLIACDHAARIGKLALKLVFMIANADEAPRWKPPARGPVAGKRLGIDGEDIDDAAARELELPDEQGGIRVTLVAQESVAEKAGLKEGDVIIEFAGEKLPRKGAMARLRELIQKAKFDVDVPIVILRGRERQTVKAQWKKN